MRDWLAVRVCERLPVGVPLELRVALPVDELDLDRAQSSFVARTSMAPPLPFAAGAHTVPPSARTKKPSGIAKPAARARAGVTLNQVTGLDE